MRATALVLKKLPSSEGPSRVRSRTEPDRSQIAWSTTQGNREKRGLDSPGGGTARRQGRQSHMGRTILSQMAGLTRDLSQYIIKNARHAQVRDQTDVRVRVV